MSPDLFQTTTLCVEVAVPLPIVGLFSYAVPPEMESKAKPGVRVRVPFKNRLLVGYVVERRESLDSERLKTVASVLDEEPVLSAAILDLTKWISRYYGSSWGEAIENALPKWVKYGKKAERAFKKEESGTRAAEPKKQIIPLRLTSDQQKAFEVIRQALKEEQPKPILLFGVTGSGKSEVYIRAIHEVLVRNQAAICLVPEIALTEQLRRFFAERFGDQLEILHSKLNDTERFLAWKRLERGERRVVLGPRSAVFAPVPDLGIILMDEEHEGSYKQETSPRYHAREVAFRRARHEKALLVMGTATPSIETMYACEAGEVRRLDLVSRIDEKKMPEVAILDLKDVRQHTRKKFVILSPKLVLEMEKNLKNHEGTMLLLNRRGFSTHIHCTSCGQVETCSSCQVSLTFHHEEEALLCHYCNFSKPVPENCFSCGQAVLKFAGFGTEKVESEVASQFPQARINRLDADSVRRKGSHEKILGDFRNQKTDILIGTQMIAKGFDFPHVTLVGVVLADVGLMLPDFRSAERTFQLLTQVAGRAGRGLKPGRVLIQTYSPQHPSVRFSKDHDYLSFYDHEVKERKEYRYPPYSRLINVILRSKEESKAYQFGRELRKSLEENFQAAGGLSPEIIGPAPLPFYRLRGQFRWHVMVRAGLDRSWSGAVIETLRALRKPAGISFAVDIDPLSIL